MKLALMLHKELALKIYEIAHLKGQFTLRSGQISNEYFDKYRFESDPLILSEIADHMVHLVPKDTEVLAGLEMGGIPVVTALSLATGYKACFVRKKAKDYGTCQFAEGAQVLNKKVCVIEDVITSGGQVLESIKDLKSSGALITSVLCVINRADDLTFKKLEKTLADQNIKLFSLFKRTDFP